MDSLFVVQQAIMGVCTPNKFQKDIVYAKGTATFGTGKDILYFYYDCTQMNSESYLPVFGDKEKRNLIFVSASEGDTCSVRFLPNDAGITMYLLVNSGQSAGTTNYILLGKQPDGAFVKYIDMDLILGQYFGIEPNQSGRRIKMKGPWFDKCYVQEDTIIIEYRLFASKQGYYKAGEFRFKWDDEAQWFGVAQVVY